MEFQQRIKNYKKETNGNERNKIHNIREKNVNPWE